MSAEAPDPNRALRKPDAKVLRTKRGARKPLSSAPGPSGTPPLLAVSSSVRAARESLPAAVTSLQVVSALLASDESYAGGAAGSFKLAAEPRDPRRRAFDEWLLDVRPLFHRQRARVLDTRLAIWGLALLDPELGGRLRKDAFLDHLVAEIPNRDEILTIAGRNHLPRRQRKDRHAPTLLDRPAEEDRLAREPFAIALAARVIQLRKAYAEARGSRERLIGAVRATRVRRRPRATPSPSEIDGPFLVHLQGAWGAGKSTVLNFFARELKTPSNMLRRAVWGPDLEEQPRLARWVVVPFNAWQHQRIAPPWWWLMTAIYQDGGKRLRELSVGGWMLFKLRDYVWRFKTRWPAYVIPVLSLSAIAIFVWLLATKTGAFEPSADKRFWDLLGGITGALSAAIALLVTLWGGMRGVKRWMLVSTAKGADNFMKTTTDPMAAVQSRYEHLVASLGHPLAIIIDDLDRCRADYVVELLEGIQTLCARAPVTYVVAADGGWVRDSFLQVYQPFAANGRAATLGYGFLDKTFQLSTSVPRIKPAVRDSYLKSLLGPGEEQPSSDIEAEDQAAVARIMHAETRHELLEAVAESTELGERARRAVREAAVLRSAGADIIEETEYLLSDFGELLESNPRSIKRLVNAFSFESKLQLLESDWVEQDEYATQRLALWTIIKLRWPPLAEYLGDNPAKIACLLDDSEPDGVPDDLRPLFSSDEVHRVVKGDSKHVSASLNEETLTILVQHQPDHER
jgi:KAP family P-loop domain